MSDNDFRDCWIKVDTWLRENSKGLFNSLNSPVAADELIKVGEHYKVTLPEDFTALYSAHNGQDTTQHVNLFYGLPYLSIKEGFENYENLVISSMEYANFPNYRYIAKEIDSSHDSPLHKFPIAGGIDVYAVFVDFRPSTNGRFGQIVFIDFEMEIAIKVADSITDMVCKFHTGLQDGSYSISTNTNEDQGTWLETSKNVDLSNWYHHRQYELPRW